MILFVYDRSVKSLFDSDALVLRLDSGVRMAWE